MKPEEDAKAADMGKDYGCMIETGVSRIMRAGRDALMPGWAIHVK